MYDRFPNWKPDYSAIPEDTREELEKKYPRKEVTQKHSISSYKVDSLIEEARAFAEEWKKSTADVNFEHEIEEDYGCTSSRAYFEVKGLETDEQWQKRLLETHQATLHAEKYDRENYERLKKKFDK